MARDLIPEPDGSPSSVAGHWWRWVLVGLAGVATLELASRVEERIAYGMPLLSRVAAASDLVLRDTLGARGRPNTVFRRWKLDSLGFRGPEIATLPAAGSIRVVTTGASETFGLYESAGHEYPRQLEDSLKALVVAQCSTQGAPKVEVVNVSLPGMALPSLARHLGRVVQPIRPRVVVLYPSPGFYLNFRAPHPADEIRSDTALPVRKAIAPRFVGRLSTQAKALAPRWFLTWSRQRAIDMRVRALPPGARYDTVPADRMAQFELDLRHAIGAMRAIGTVPVLAGYVNATMAPGFDDTGMLIAWEYQFPRARRDVIPAFHAQAAERIAQVATDSGVTYVDLKAAFEGRWNGAFADFVHFTNQGSAIVAGAIARTLVPPSETGAVCRGQLAPQH